MRAIFTKQALVNYASMVKKYGDIYLNEYGQISLSKESHEAKYQDEKRKVPTKSCMYVNLNQSNFPKDVDTLEEMFLKQTLQRDAKGRQDKEASKFTRTPEVVVGDESAFEEMTGGETAPETETPAKKGGRPKKTE
jgi:hypothetical protein